MLHWNHLLPPLPFLRPVRSAYRARHPRVPLVDVTNVTRSTFPTCTGVTVPTCTHVSGDGRDEVLLSDHRLDHPGDRGGKNLLKAPARFAAQEFRPGKGLGPDRRILRQGRKFLVGCFGRPSRLVPKHRPLPCFYRPLKRIDFHRARYSMGTSSFCQGTRQLRVRASTRASTALTHQKRAFGPP